MKSKKRMMYKDGGMKKNGNASARREQMQYGGMGMKKKPMKNGGMYKEEMPKAKPC
jgi:hypothetical protein